MKRTKMISALLVTAFVLSLSSGVLAYNTNDKVGVSVENEVVCLTRSVNPRIIENFENVTLAMVTEKDGTVTPVNCTVTIEEITGLPALNRANLDEPIARTYSATVKANVKNISESADKNDSGITASASITMTWTDNVGFYNTINRLTGSAIITKGTFKSSFITWGHDTNVGNLWVNDKLKFDTSPNYTVCDECSSSTIPINGDIFGRYTIYFTNSTNLSVEVKPGIFD